MTDLLALIALSQVVLYLWYTGRITGAVAASGFAGTLLFAALARAVREAFAERAAEASALPPPKRIRERARPRTEDRSARKATVRYQ